MMLLLDIGNSRIKWAVWNGTKLQSGGAREHGGNSAGLLDSLELPHAEAVRVSQVLDMEPELTAKLRQRCGVTPQFAHTASLWNGLRIAYAEPRRLGVDRWLSMVALWNETRGAFAVANAGTALTFDAVDASGRHLGGLIAPGLSTAQKAVLGATRFDARLQAVPYTGGLGHDTESCVHQGALHACAGLIERAARLSAGPQIITGGDAGQLLPHLPGTWTPRPDLVLEGLLALARGEEMSS